MTSPPFHGRARPAERAGARGEGGRNRYYRAEVFLAQGGRDYDIFGYETEQVIADVINHYDRFRHYLHISGKA